MADGLIILAGLCVFPVLVSVLTGYWLCGGVFFWLMTFFFWLGAVAKCIEERRKKKDDE